ncbi:MAG: methyltransferase domain-containing protein [Patescibacteria group bacterium]
MFKTLLSSLWSGKSVTRGLLDYRLAQETLKGKVIDIGGGTNPAYIGFMKKEEGAVVQSFDVKIGAITDFETDVLPAATDNFDSVLFLNVMEHIFNHQHIANEVVRIVKPGGQLIGFVPFLMWYHPDHKDFFRYTHEALEIIFNKAGAKKIKIESIAYGPFTAAAHIILLSFPRILRAPLYVLFFIADWMYLKFRPGQGSKFALGYFFTFTK